MTDAKLSYADTGASEHHSCMKILATALTFDQINVTELACMELVGRRVQMIESKYKPRLLSQTPSSGASGDPFEDSHLYMGMNAIRGLVCLSPALETWIGQELSKESLVAKERRKAAEERSMVAPKKGGKA